MGAGAAEEVQPPAGAHAAVSSAHPRWGGADEVQRSRRPWLESAWYQKIQPHEDIIVLSTCTWFLILRHYTPKSTPSSKDSEVSMASVVSSVESSTIYDIVDQMEPEPLLSSQYNNGEDLLKALAVKVRVTLVALRAGSLSYEISSAAL